MEWVRSRVSYSFFCPEGERKSIVNFKRTLICHDVSTTRPVFLLQRIPTKIDFLKVEWRQFLKRFQEGALTLCGLEIFMTRVFRHRFPPQSTYASTSAKDALAARLTAWIFYHVYFEYELLSVQMLTGWPCCPFGLSTVHWGLPGMGKNTCGLEAPRQVPPKSKCDF